MADAPASVDAITRVASPFPAACIFNEQPVSSPGLVMTGGKIMAWVYLIIAGLLEIGWAIGLKYTDGFTRLWPSLATIIGMLFSFGLLSIALKTIPVGTGYAVWTGIGAAGTAIIGMMFLGESKDIGRLVCLGLIVAGVIGLKMFTKTA